MVEANHGDIAVALPRRWILLFSINRRRVGSQACHSTQRLGVMCLRAFGTGFKIGQSIINFFNAKGMDKAPPSDLQGCCSCRKDLKPGCFRVTGQIHENIDFQPADEAQQSAVIQRFNTVPMRHRLLQKLRYFILLSCHEGVDLES